MIKVNFRETPSNSRMPWPETLLAWYDRVKRPLPWRLDPSPYRVWISEIMLQQTQVDTVLPYFRRFLRQFPTLRRLAAADLSQVFKLWEGLGYYRRARHLHQAAQTVMTAHNGIIPRSFAELRQLPGIGDYTAAAIASIAFGEGVPVVDGNVLRVFTRFRGIADDIRLTSTRQSIFSRLQSVFKSDVFPVRSGKICGDFNQAMMELGALVCTPRNPNCGACPLRAWCVAFRDDRVAELPRKSARPTVPHYEIAVGIIRKGKKLLIARRRPEQMLGGLWEFPGGKRRADETLADTACREIREETGLQVRVGEPLITVKHGYSHFRIILTAFLCEYVAGQARAKSAETLKWVLPGELKNHAFPRANQKIIEALAER